MIPNPETFPHGILPTPYEWENGTSTHAIAATLFDPTSLDTLEDNARESLANGGSIKQIFEAWNRDALRAAMSEGIRAALSEILDSKKPQLAAAQLGFSVGLDAIMGWTGPQMAKRFGISKQAFFQGVDVFRERYGCGLKRINGRSQAARTNMSKRNYRK